MRAVGASACVAIGLLFAAATSARAQTPEGKPEPAPAPEATPAAPGDDVEQRAVELFQLGERAYFLGDYVQAIYYLEQAVELRSNPVLLYNLARTYERARRIEKAIETYRAYLEASPEASDRKTIEARIASLERERVERAAAEARVVGTPAPVPAPEPSTSAQPPADPAHAPAGAASGAASDGAGAVPWIVAGVGLLGVGAGAGLWFVASGAHDKAVREPVQRRANELQSNAEDLTVAGNVTFIAGGTVLLVGVLWGIVDAAEGGSGAERAGVPRLRFGPAAVSIEGTL